MLAQACIQAEYYEKVIDAVRFYSRTTREMRPFETLVNLMYQRPISPQFQVKKKKNLGDIITSTLLFFFFQLRINNWITTSKT